MESVLEDFYTELAPHYHDYVRGKAKYLEAIDKLVLNSLKGDSILDVGAGDGLRSFEIARMAGIENIVLVEPNKVMANICRENTRYDVIETGAEELLGVNGKYDNILCLHNVLGHVPDESSRVTALKNMRDRLTPEGSIYLDVNNRHNIRAYGFKTVKSNLTKDLFGKDNSHGDVSFDIEVNGENIRASGHVFSLGEMDDLIGEAELKVRKKCFVDYKNGSKALTQFGGQMYFELGLD